MRPTPEKDYSTDTLPNAPMTAAIPKQEKTKITPSVEAKEAALRAMMRRMRTVLVAFSGGVDSSYLALVARQELGENAVCVTGISPSVSQIQREEAEKIARHFRLNHIKIETEEMSDPNYRANPSNRCYFCKTELYSKLSALAREKKIAYILDGTNADDVGDHRPGRKAAEEKNVSSPLVEVGLSKSEIRELSRRQNLPTWDKPASPCLSSRIAYNIPVTIERLSRVERGEEILRKAGFTEFRVRIHDDLARLEIAPAELERALNGEMTARLASEFRRLGFRYVCLDLQGFRSGAMNEIFDE